jgi:thioredoxin-dependent peroxiredoxin
METDQSGELAVGDPAPDFRLPAGDGREIALSAYRGKAHVVLFFVRAYG